jgi:hypothetical protein
MDPAKRNSLLTELRAVIGRDGRVERRPGSCLSLNFRVLAEWKTLAYGVLMGRFYVFHASPRSRARIHDGECEFCRNGQGREKQYRNGSGVTGWDGPFLTLDEARVKMATFKFRHMGHCKHCLGA